MRYHNYDELLAIEEQLPKSECPVYHEGLGDKIPLEEHTYMEPVKRPNTVVIPLDKMYYASLTEARARLEALLEHRSLECYHTFQTARSFVFYCLPRKGDK